MKVLLLFPILLNFYLYSGNFGAGEKDVRWRKDKITICWGGSYQINNTLTSAIPGSGLFKLKYSQNVKIEFIDKKRQQYIKKLILEHYPKSLTTKELIGWEQCSAETKSDLVIMGVKKISFEKSSGHNHFDSMNPFKANNIRPLIDYEKEKFKQNVPAYRGVSNIGNSYENFDMKLKKYKVLKYPQSSKYQVYMPDLSDAGILHEFGHLLGLRHEHLREQANLDPNCSLLKIKIKEQYDKSTSFFSRYDPKSIMNYCYLEYLTETIEGRKIKPELSLGDKHAIKCLYDDTRINCDDGYVVTEL